jgi:hypothetical protein
MVLRPDGCLSRRAAAVVKAGRRPPPKAARSGLDGGEGGASFLVGTRAVSGVT